MSPEDLMKVKAKFGMSDAVARLSLDKSESTSRGKTLCEVFAAAAQKSDAFVRDPSKAKKRIRQDAKPLMNKLESEWCEMLKRHAVETGWEGGHKGYVFNIRVQAKRYRLGNGIWYKPDFTGTVDLRETAWEVKGPHAFRGGFENLKVAASAYPEIKWVLAWKEQGRWLTQEVLP